MISTLRRHAWLLASCVLTAAACADPEPELSPCCVAAAKERATEASHGAAQDPAAPEAAATAAVDPSEDSVYLVDVPWVDQAGAKRHLSDFAGKPVIVSMIFTHCQYACPRLVADMQKVEAGLAPADRDRVHFLLVSMDDVRDTPQQLAAFAADKGLSTPRWTLLHGGAGDVQLFNAVLGGRYKRTPSGDFAHSNLVVVLNRDGQIVHRQEGLGVAPDESLAVLTGLLAEPESPRREPPAALK